MTATTNEVSALNAKVAKLSTQLERLSGLVESLAKAQGEN